MFSGKIFDKVAVRVLLFLLILVGWERKIWLNGSGGWWIKGGADMFVICGMEAEAGEEVLCAGEETLGLGKSYSGGHQVILVRNDENILMGGGKKMTGAS